MKKLKPLEYALWLLGKQDRSIGEMEEKLRRRECSKEEISKTLDFLISNKFLDDQKFAENFVRFKKSLKPVGKYYLRSKLLAKRVPNEIIEKVLLENSDELSEISKAANHFFAENKKIPKEKIYQKLVRHLLSRGFEWEKVREVVSGKM
ncbi:MAG: regulatory protein [Candidatus Berkelbacteria bacterium Athens1014_28]|uniref:Regulatory protein RecX n=1 Tax=Candidatus Berkelbacteria bacterium Athens1014_28 TaxID=2017145 RepID=A0A554LLI1_9BACT|nr:MAG: regulatory protein [Candidatus Berkelbacteria bacterium Athens1014_28]